MVKYPPLIIAVCILLSCSNNNQAVNLQEGIKSDTSAKATAILFSYPEIIDSSHIVIYPLILERTSYGSGISSSYGGERTTYWNLIFYNTDDKTQKLLTKDKRIIITSMKSNDKSSTSSDYRWSEGIDIYENHIFYEVVSKDFNQNNYLDINDPTYLYVSDKKGNNFRQLSPDNYNVTSWQVVKGTSKIILQGQKDSNGDKRFDSNDEVIPLIVDVNSGKLGTETFNQSYIDSLKRVLGNTWKNTK